MAAFIAVITFLAGMTGQIKYPAICKETYLSEKKAQDVDKAIKTLSSKPGCMQIGEEIITEGERVGEIFPIYTCCTSIEVERQ